MEEAETILEKKIEKKTMEGWVEKEESDKKPLKKKGEIPTRKSPIKKG